MEARIDVHPVDAEVAELLVAQETALLLPEVRASVDALDRLIADDFHEIGANGRSFGKDEVMSRLPGESGIAFVARDYALRRVSEDLIVVLYRAERGVEGSSAASLRSSWWRRESAGWRMVFHQGTPLAAATSAGDDR